MNTRGLKRLYLQLLPPAVRHAGANAYHKALRALGDDRSRLKLYKSYIDETRSIFIHIPKCAGTSVAKALYGDDPGHHTADQYHYANPVKFERYFKFSIVRNPYDRTYSMYKYLSARAEKYPNTLINKAGKFATFEQFVQEWLADERLLESFLFTWPQMRFVYSGQKLAVDYLIKMENLEVGFSKIKARVRPNAQLVHINQGNNKPYNWSDNNSTRRIVESVYKDDFELFGY